MSDGWSVAVLQVEDGETLLRSRVRLPEPADRARLPVAIWISWPWGAIASEAEQDAASDDMLAFEDAVHRAAEAGGWGMLVGVLTNGFGREWLWYAAHRDEFVGELRGAIEGQAVHPFTVRAWDDPTWRAARELNPRAFMH